MPRAPVVELPTIRPMLAQPGDLPPDEARWLFEVKYDGWRAIVYLDRGALRVVSRRGNDLTDRLPELQPLARALERHRLILDGEIIAPGAGGRPDFEALQLRMLGGGSAPLCLMLFDLLYRDGESLVPRPLEDRKRQLGELALEGDAWRTVSYSVGNGAALLAASREHGLEGLIAKRLDSRYTPGRRSPHWIKIKNFASREMIIGGWIEHGDGTHGILVGDADGGRIVFAGIVDIDVAPKLIGLLQTLEQPASPFAAAKLPRKARFVRPELVADVQYLAGSDVLRDARLGDVRMR